MVRGRVVRACALACGVACGGGAQDVGGNGTDLFMAPDLTGRYVTDVGRTEVVAGTCEGEQAPDALLGWLEGEMTVSGPPEALTFSLAEGDVVSGSVDTAFEVTWDDTVSRADGEFALSGIGLAYIDAGLWIIEMDLEVAVAAGSSESTGCSLTALFEAGQISE